MRMIALKVGVFVLLVIVFSVSLDPRRTKAAPQDVFPQAACVAYVPQLWGDYKGGSQPTGLAFQDQGATLRRLTSIPCGGVPLVATEIRRSSGN
jgi:hypothetical protein